MVTYGGMAKQPVIASVVSWWGRQAWTQAWMPQLSRPTGALVPGGSLPQAASEVLALRAPGHPSCVHRASSFLRISNFEAFGCPSGRRTTVQVSGCWPHHQGSHERAVPTAEVTRHPEAWTGDEFPSATTG